MPAFGLVLTASLVRAASLNLCTDEYLLLLARPDEVVSVSHLSHRAQESQLWKQARQSPSNSGSLESALRFRPELVFTMGGSGRDTAAIARRLGIRLVQLPFPTTIGDVERQARRVAAELGDIRRAEPFSKRLRGLREVPVKATNAAFLTGGGQSLTPSSLGAEWMSLAGYRQRALPGGRLTLEQLAYRPPERLIRSRYRSDQFDRGQAWLRHPLVRRLSGRMIDTDGRPWTCAGLPMIGEIERLKRFAR